MTITAMTQPATPIKICIDVHNDTEWTSTSPTATDVPALIKRLNRTPTEKSAEEIAAREERAKALADVETAHKVDRARRANERVRDNVARKLRLESAAVQRAQSKIESKALAKTAKQEELDAKRRASAERTRALFDAVREAREARQLTREARIAALAEVESRAAAAKSKRIASTVAKSAAQVKHAATVAAEKKRAEKEATAAAAAALTEKLEAAAGRRTEKLAATVETAAAVIAAAERTRVRKLHDERASAEARKMRLGRAMEGAFGRRQGALDSIQTKAAAENARIATAVAQIKEEVDSKPAALAHALAVRMQAAEVNHGLAALAQTRARAKAGVLLLIPADNLRPTAAPLPGLLERLMFRPRMLLATAGARQAAAAGRRATIKAVKVSRAAHLGNVRVALVRGRKAAHLEIIRSLAELKCSTVCARGKVLLRNKQEKAARANERVAQAAVARSKQRLAVLERAVAQEERRQKGALMRNCRLRVDGAPWSAARAAAFGERRLAADTKRAVAGATFAARCTAAEVRYAGELARRVAIAKKGRQLTLAGKKAAAEEAVAAAATAVYRSVALKVVEGAIAAAVASQVGRAVSVALEASTASPGRIAQAAAASDAAAARAVAKAAAKASEDVAARAVEVAAAEAGLQGSPAKRAAAAAGLPLHGTPAKHAALTPTPPPPVPSTADVAAAVEALSSSASSAVTSAYTSAASSDSEEWHVLKAKDVNANRA
mmetsp:Transcript_1280/g.3603  ORF Transcript_1280/g.3603 Transcript_1280/m.3603 type:complete len:726 (-) Transcript_1280:784-2961(-)